MAPKLFKNPIGRGMAFPFQFSEGTGGVLTRSTAARSEEVQLVKESIQQILATEFGSRVMRRDFGSALPSLVFELKDNNLALRLKEATAGAIQRWEDRVTVNNVRIIGDPSNLDLIMIEVDYNINKSNTSDVTSVPFLAQV